MSSAGTSWHSALASTLAESVVFLAGFYQLTCHVSHEDSSVILGEFLDGVVKAVHVDESPLFVASITDALNDA